MPASRWPSTEQKNVKVADSAMNRTTADPLAITFDWPITLPLASSIVTSWSVPDLLVHSMVGCPAAIVSSVVSYASAPPGSPPRLRRIPT
jgi:hypothetical protein